MKISFLILVAFVCSISVLAQQNKATQMGQPHKVKSDSLPPARNLQLIARSYGDSVVLRWAPAKATLWYFANKAGYSVLRYEVREKKNRSFKPGEINSDAH